MNEKQSVFRFLKLSTVNLLLGLLVEQTYLVNATPVITTQPANQTVVLGTSATFSVTASGSAPLAYHWLFNSAPISPATNSSFTISNANHADAGDYQVVVTNVFGSVTSSVAQLTVLPYLATGGSISVASNTTIIHVFTNNGVLVPQVQLIAKVLVVGGGGGGGGTAATPGYYGGGGGGGGLVTSNNFFLLPGNSVFVSVGSGGMGGSSSLSGVSGGNSSFGNLVALGGGGGGSGTAGAVNGLTGGSGGGGGRSSSDGIAGAGTIGQGNTGAAASPTPRGGGGGGAGTTGMAADGGNGASPTLLFGSTFFAGGGGAGGVAPGTGGLGGGGAGAADGNGNPGIPNTGGGGGGGGSTGAPRFGGAGGSGIVIVSYTLSPVITTQPTSQTAVVGSDVSFSVTAYGPATPMFQWRKDGVSLENQTTTTLTLTNVQFADAGTYDVVVTNIFGSVTSVVATLAIAEGLGSSPTNAALSAKHLLNSQPGVPSGLYWLDTDGAGANPPFLAYCDMSLVGGGWVLALNSVVGSEATTTEITNNIGIPGLTNGHVRSVRSLALHAELRHEIIHGLRKFHAFYHGDYYSNMAGGQWFALLDHNDFALLQNSWGRPFMNSIYGVRWYWNGPHTATPVNLNDDWNGPKNEQQGPIHRYSIWVREFSLPPILTSQPASLTNLASTSASFSVTSAGTPPLAYQWRKNGENLNGGTNATLLFVSTSATDAGNYDVVITNSYGSVTSTVATLTLVTLPTISTQPENRTNLVGTTAAFNVSAAGTPPLIYRWRKNGSPLSNVGNISGADTVTLTLTGVTEADAGNYDVEVSNPYGTNISSTASLTVLSPVPVAPSGLTAVSVQPYRVTLTWTDNATNETSFRIERSLNGTSFSEIDFVGTNTTSFDDNTVQPGTHYYYRVRAANSAGFSPYSNQAEVTTQTGNLSILPETLPVDWILGRPDPSYATSQIVPVTGQPFTTALRVSTLKKPANLWEVQVFVPTTASVASNDLLRVVYYLRQVQAQPDGEAQAAFLFQRAGPPWETSGYFLGAEHLGEWRRYEYLFRVLDNYPAGTALGAFHLGHDTQVIEIGGVSVEHYSHSDTNPPSLLPDILPYGWNFHRPNAGVALSQIVPVSGQPFTNAIRVTTLQRPAFPHEVQLNIPTVAPVASNMPLMGTFHLRRPTGTERADTAFVFGRSTSPWDQSAYLPFNENTGDWQRFQTVFHAHDNFAAGAAELNFVLGVDPQGIEIGGVSLTIILAPFITVQPTPAAAIMGGTASFTVTAVAASPLYYQWRKGGITLSDGGGISGANTPTLVITQIEPGDVANYDVVITNVHGTATSEVATLILETAPSITSHPQATNAVAGDAVRFTVTATGTTPLSYYWRKDGVPLSDGGSISGAGTPVLQIANAGLTNIGAYDVVVSNRWSAVTSTVAQLSVYIPPSLGVFDVSTPAEGVTLVLNGNPGDCTSVLRATNLSGPWEIVATIIYGPNGTASYLDGSPPTSQAFYRTEGLPGGAPVIRSQPSSAEVASGENINFTVAVSTCSAVTYQWRKNGTPLNDDSRVAGSQSNQLMLTDTIPGDAGNYDVIVSNSSGSVTSQVAILSVVAPPSIVTQPTGLTNAAGTTALFSVAVQGTPPFGYQWRKGGAHLTENPNVVGVFSPTLVISNVALADSGDYDVVITNGFGSITSAVAVLTVHVLHVSERISNILAAGTSEYVSLGRYASNTLNGIKLDTSFWMTTPSQPWDRDPAITFDLQGLYRVDRFLIWNSHVLDPAIKRMRVEYSQDGTNYQSLDELTLSPGTNSEDPSGNHPLPPIQARFVRFDILENYAGTTFPFAGNPVVDWLVAVDEVEFYGEMIAPVRPQITQQPTGITNCLPGGSFTLSGDAIGTPPLAFQWQLNGNPVPDATNRTHTISALSPVNSGSYTLVASNSAGETPSSSALVTVSTDLFTNTIPPAGLLVYLPLDGTPNDLSGNARHAQNFGGVITRDRRDRFGGAYAFTNAFMRVGIDPDDYATGFSFGCWFKYTSECCPPAPFYWPSEGGGATLIALAQNSLTVRCGSSSPSTSHTVSGLSVPMNQWQHVMVTHGAAMDRLYLNGAMVGEWPSLPLQGNAPIVNLSSDLQGALDNVTIYGRELTPSEVQTLAAP